MNFLKTLLLLWIIVIGWYLLARWLYMPFTTPSSVSPREEASFLKLDSEFSLQEKEKYPSFEEMKTSTWKASLFEEPNKTDYSF